MEKREELKKARTDKDEKPSKEERVAMRNERMDEKIAMQRKMKSILNDDQFDKWQKMSQRRDKGKRGHGKRRGPRTK